MAAYFQQWRQRVPGRMFPVVAGVISGGNIIKTPKTLVRLRYGGF